MSPTRRDVLAQLAALVALPRVRWESLAADPLGGTIAEYQAGRRRGLWTAAEVTARALERCRSDGAKWRANLRRVGPSVAVKEANPQSELPTFLRVYDSMRERKDFVDHHQIQHLSRFIAAAGPAVRPRLFLAYDGERAVAGSIVVDRPGKAADSAGSSEEDPSRITMSVKRATAVCPSGVSVCNRKRSSDASAG